jgi:hypothetical protein
MIDPASRHSDSTRQSRFSATGAPHRVDSDGCNTDARTELRVGNKPPLQDVALLLILYAEHLNKLLISL